MSRLTLILVATLALLAAATAGGANPPAIDLGPHTSTTVVDSVAGPITVTTSTKAAVPTGRSEPATTDGVKPAIAHGIYFQEWEQKASSTFLGIGWTEKHIGGRYYSGNFVWQASRWGWDNAGYHRCGYSTGIGLAISTKSCWRTGDPSGYSRPLTDGDQFSVTAFFNGFPLSNTLEIRACFDPNGGSWQC
jgi:hypothetical protein